MTESKYILVNLTWVSLNTSNSIALESIAKIYSLLSIRPEKPTNHSK